MSDAKYVMVTAASYALNVSVDTIRRWNKQGLIKATRDKNNRRLFNLEEIKRLQNKLSGKKDSTKYQILKSKQMYEEATCIDLFAGAGGTALGFHNAGINHIMLNELDSNAVATLKANSKKHKLRWNIIEGDVAGLDFGEYVGAAIIQAGFPCQAFSYAGKSRGFEDTRGTLFFEFARAVKEVKPKIAIGENVRGLINHDGGKTLATMLKTLDDLGYKVNYRVLRAQYLDVPQKRERLILFAVRKDLECPIVFPKERDYFISMRQALKNCPSSEGQTYPKRKSEIMDMVPEGGNWRNLPISIQKEYMKGSFYLSGGKTGMARRMAWDLPCLTLTCSPAQKQTERCHPTQTRPLTVREYARIQTFPDNWEFTGKMTAKYKQIGNAVPVNLGYHVGRCVLASLGLIPITDDMDVVKELEI